MAPARRTTRAARPGELGSGKVEYFIPTAGLDGTLAIGLSAASGHGRIDRCTVRPQAP